MTPQIASKNLPKNHYYVWKLIFNYSGIRDFSQSPAVKFLHLQTMELIEISSFE